MALEQLKVREIVKQAVSKNLDIPEFQREFVWDPEQVKLLAESLYRDYPVGSFLLWDSSEYQEAKTAQGTQASLWIVDGQQRTTALCLLLGMKPFWWPDAQDWNKTLERYDVMVNLPLEQGDNRLKFGLPNPILRKDPYWVSIRQILSRENVEDLTPLAQEIVKRISSDPDQRMKQFALVHAHLQRLWQIRERDIPIIKIAHEVEDVAVIFARLNQEGTRVKEADVILALVAVRNPGWVREKFLPFRDELKERGWDLDAGIFIRTMTGIDKGRARLGKGSEEFWTPEDLGKVWKNASSIIAEVLKRLAEFGITSADLLPSTNSLIPLFVLHYRWGDSSNYSFNKAVYWLLRANWDGRYSGSAITSLDEDVRAIVEAENFDMALKNLEDRLRVPSEIAEDEFLNRYDRAGYRFLRLMLYLVLFRKEACDWVDGTRIGYDKTGPQIIAGFEPQWHHIYPRKVLRQEKIKDDDINALANITVLNERTNVNKLGGKMPSEYIQKFDIKVETLLSHLVPPSFAESRNDEVWSVEHYTDFLKERAQLLAKEANVFLRKLRGS